MSIKQELKEVIVRELHMEDLSPDDIADDEPLFGEGIGLDSLDAVELVVVIKKHFNVEIKDMTDGREAFTSVETLAKFIEDRKEG